MNFHHSVPFIDGHIDDHAIANNAGVADQSVETTEGTNGLLHHATSTIPVADIIIINDGFAAHGFDGCYDLGCRADVMSFTSE